MGDYHDHHESSVSEDEEFPIFPASSYPYPTIIIQKQLTSVGRTKIAIFCYSIAESGKYVSERVRLVRHCIAGILNTHSSHRYKNIHTSIVTIIIQARAREYYGSWLGILQQWSGEASDGLRNLFSHRKYVGWG